MSVETFDFPIIETSFQEFEASRERVDEILGALSTSNDDLDTDIQNAQHLGVELPNPCDDHCRYVRVAGRILAQSGAYFHVLTYAELKQYLHSLTPDQLNWVKLARTGTYPLPFRE